MFSLTHPAAASSTLCPQDWDETSGELPFDVVLTCYTLFERGKDYGRDRIFLSKWAWSHLVREPFTSICSVCLFTRPQGKQDSGSTG